MKQKFEQTELTEFQEFLSTSPTTPSKATQNSIYKTAKSAILKQKTTIFAKLLLIHTVMSTASLTICHQFDMNPFNSKISLSHYFMTFGHSACMLFCGTLFVGGSLLAARAILNKHEFQFIKNSFPLQILILCSLSIAVFMALGAHLTLSITLFWILGAYIGSTLTTFVRLPQPLR